jgi:hypothetical protein
MHSQSLFLDVILRNFYSGAKCTLYNVSMIHFKLILPRTLTDRPCDPFSCLMTNICSHFLLPFMHVLIQPTSTSHPRQSKIIGTNQKVFYNIIFFVSWHSTISAAPHFRTSSACVLLLHSRSKFRHTYKRKEAALQKTKRSKHITKCSYSVNY